MRRWTEVVRYSVIDLTNPRDAIFLAAGFYWFIPLDGAQAQPGLAEDHQVSLVGPFATREAARDDAVRWVHETLQSPDNDTHYIRRAA